MEFDESTLRLVAPPVTPSWPEISYEDVVAPESEVPALTPPVAGSREAASV
jgi:hypothetical protein